LTFSCRDILDAAAVGVLDNHSVVAENQELRKDPIYNPGYSTTLQGPSYAGAVSFSKSKVKEFSPERSVNNIENSRDKERNT
jgi:hypothetical protein